MKTHLLTGESHERNAAVINAMTLMESWWTIGALGLVTFTTRVAGVGLAEWMPRNRFFAAMLQHLPSTLLVAFVVPYFTSGNLARMVAATLVLVAAASGAPLLASTTIGIVAIALLRAAGG